MGGQQGPGPRQHPFAGLGKTLEALASGDQHQVQFILQVAQAHRQRGLGDVAARGRLAEVAGLLQGDQELELFDVHDGTCWRGSEGLSIDAGVQDTRRGANVRCGRSHCLWRASNHCCLRGYRRALSLMFFLAVLY
ncbi:hypothetical protein D9M71_496490 [compost metagenome]